MKFVRCVKTCNIASGAAFLILGIILMLMPEMSLIALSFAAGIIFIVSGIIRLLGYFSNDLYSLAFQFDFALGIFSMLFGLVLIFNPSWLVSTIQIIMGIFVLINGLFALQTAMDSKRFGMKFWWIIVVFAIVSSIFGIVLIINPFKSGVMIAAATGITLAFAGLEKIFLSFYTIVVKKTNRINMSSNDYGKGERDN